MSKNHTNKDLKQRIRKQQKEIERLRYYNSELGMAVDELHLHTLSMFANVITTVYEQMMMDEISEDQAGKLMVALTGAMQCADE